MRRMFYTILAILILIPAITGADLLVGEVFGKEHGYFGLANHFLKAGNYLASHTGVPFSDFQVGIVVWIVIGLVSTAWLTDARSRY